VLRSTHQWQVFVLAALFGSALLIFLWRPAQQPELRVLASSPVLVQPVLKEDLRPVEVVSGYLRPSRRAWLNFEVDGRVSQRLVQPGQSVLTGDSLLTLDAADYQTALAQARAELQQVQADLERDRRLLKLAERSRQLQDEELERLESLSERSMASKTRLGDAAALLAQRMSEEARLRSSVANGPARIASRQAAVDRARNDLARTSLQAPFSGKVNQVKLEVGDFASRSREVIELTDDRLEFYAQVRGVVARSLRIGQIVDVQVEGRPWPATVVAVQPDPDPVTFTHAIRLRMPESEDRSGTVAVARLPLAVLHEVLVVPATALLIEEDGVFVFRVRDDRLQRVAVRPGSRVGLKQVIRDGIEAGEQVVVRDVAALADGQAVVVKLLHP
jgi:RND family efflux transporter MFP subunit